MKKLISIFTMLFVAKASIAQQPKTVPAKIDTSGSDKIPRGAKIEDLIKQLPTLINDTSAAVIRTDHRDFTMPPKDTTDAKLTDPAILNELLKKMGRIEVDKNGVVKQNGKVIIEKARKVIYKMDTVQYNPSHYKVGPKAKLTELLNKLPGIEVDSTGTVIHQGVVIYSLKVDNNSIPISSLTKATKTIPADAVETVEIIDDYGDKAASIGAGKSAEPNKLLNITLKKGKKVDLKMLRTGR